MKLAVLDLGSNSFHCLLSEVREQAELVKIHSEKEALRLGGVVARFGQLNEPAFQAAYSSVKRMSARARQLGAEKVLAVATSALREAGNGAAFCARCEDTLGVQVELLSGEAEARLAYLGARSSIGSSAGRVLVVDVGGGSVELAVGDGATCDVVQSLPLGFLRLAQTFPLSEVGCAGRLTRYVQLECEKARWQMGRFDTLLLAGGTARALGKLLGGGIASASTGQVLELCHRVRAASPADLVEMGVDAARSVSLATGAAVVAGILAGFKQRELRISPRGLREGVLLRELKRRAPTQAA